VAALGVGLGVPLAQGGLRPLAALGVFLAAWVLLGVLVALREARGRAGGRLRALPRGVWGMLVAHAGLAVVVVGITLVSSYQSERDVRMNVGDHVDLAGHRVVFRGATGHPGPNYVADRATMEVTAPDGRQFTLYPEKRKYNATGVGMTEAALRSGVLGDLYVSLGEHLGGHAWSVRVYHKPFVGWLWAGGALMALGGLLAASDRRYRRAPAGEEAVA
jgi:cytochrome c-type biogenesis protein CcmF